jgi:hypothetical protein
MESGTEEGLQWRKIGEVDAWAMGDECAALGRGRTRRMAHGGENFRPVGGGFILLGAVGRGARIGGRRVEAEWERERDRGGGALGVARSSAAALRRRGCDADGVANSWAGTRRGPNHQRLGAVRGSAVRWLARR